MRDLRTRLRAAVVFCAAGPVTSFLPSYLPARATAGGSVASSCTEGVPARAGAFRAPVASTRLEAAAAAADQLPDGPGHALRDGDAAPAESMESRSSQVGGEEEAGQAPSMAAAATQEMDAAAFGVGQSAEEEQVMAELLAQQPGGQEEGVGPEPAKRVRKRLKKYFPKDFQDTTWTVAVQWNHAKYEVQTTKFALKADGSVVWLDKGKGSWIMRTKSRDISIYRNFFLNWGGMRIYSAKLLNNTCDMYLSGIIKGWQPFLPLSKMGTWQAVKRGITIDENTPRPPWEAKEVVEEVTFGDGRTRKNTPIEVEVDL